MKAKSFSRKLVLNKRTVVHLANDDMSNAKGGATELVGTCGCPPPPPVDTIACHIPNSLGCSDYANSCVDTCGLCWSWGVVTCW